MMAAIRDLLEDARRDGRIGAAFGRPWTDLMTAGRRLRRGRVLTGLAATLAAPWHLLTAFRGFNSRGPLLLLAGCPLVAGGPHHTGVPPSPSRSPRPSPPDAIH